MDEIEAEDSTELMPPLKYSVSECLKSINRRKNTIFCTESNQKIVQWPFLTVTSHFLILRHIVNLFSQFELPVVSVMILTSYDNYFWSKLTISSGLHMLER